jgi:hypothetical protein
MKHIHQSKFELMYCHNYSMHRSSKKKKNTSRFHRRKSKSIQFDFRLDRVYLIAYENKVENRWMKKHWFREFSPE